MTDPRKTGATPVPRTLLWPVADIDAAVEFYTKALHLHLKFRDGDRYAALAAGDLTLALVAGEEDVTGGLPAPAYLVADLAEAVAEAEREGAAVVVRSQSGPHETRAVLTDPSGHPVVLYQRL